MRIDKDIKCIFIALIPAIIFTIAWSIANTSIPTADGGAYFFESFRYYDVFVTPDQKIPFIEGFVKGIWKIISARSWKPISFPIFAVPFLLISGGNIGFSLAALAISTISITVVYAYHLIKVGFNNDRLIATLGAMLIGITPTVQAYALTNFAETAMLGAIFATLFYLIKSDYLRNYKKSIYFIVSLTIAITIRPVEVVVALSLPLAYFFYNGKKEGIFSSKEILQICNFAFISISILLITPYIAYYGGVIKSMFDRTIDFEGVRKSYFIMTLLTVVTTVIFSIIFHKKYKPDIFSRSFIKNIYSKNSSNSNSFITSISARFFLINIIWWIPATHLLYQWTYVTSFGVLGTELVYGFSSKFDILNSAIISNGSYILYALLVVFIFQQCCFRKRIKKFYNKDLIIYTSLIIILPIILILLTTQQSGRKLSIAVSFVILIVSSFVLVPGIFRKVRIFSIIVIIIIQFSSLILFHFYEKSSIPQLNLAKFSGDIPKPIERNYDLEIFEYLKTAQKKYNFHSTSILFIKGPFDVFVVGGLTSTSLNKQDFFAGFMYTPEFKDDLYLEAKRRGFETMLISNPFKKAEYSDQYYKKLKHYRDCNNYKECTLGFLGFASGKMMSDILLRMYENRLEESHFKLLETKVINGYEFYLLKII